MHGGRLGSPGPAAFWSDGERVAVTSLPSGGQEIAALDLSTSAVSTKAPDKARWHGAPTQPSHGGSPAKP